MSAAQSLRRGGVRLGLLCALSACVALSGCATVRNAFHTKSSTAKKQDKPNALVPLPNRIALQRVWSDSLGGEKPKLRLGLDVASGEQRVFIANAKGEVEALNLQNGKRLWRRNLKAPLSAGPSTGDNLVLLGTSKGEVIALSASDGSVHWRVRINAEILAAPAIGEDLIAVRGVDGKMHALSPTDGSEQWLVDQTVPRLTLRGTSTPTLVRDFVVCGFDNGRVIAVLRRNGSTVWDTTVGQAHGNTELARLSDVDADVVADGDDLFAVAYQGRVVRLAMESGQVAWTRDMSSYRGLAVDANALYVSTADGELVRLDRRNGTEQWRQKALLRRQLTAPVLYQGRLVVADAGGVIHWLDPSSGHFVARALIGKSVRGKAVQSKGIKVKLRVSTAPVVAGDLLLVFSDAGELSAYRAPPLPDATPTAATLAPRSATEP